MGSLVRYDFDGSVARITMDDGKVNVLSQEMLAELNEALGRAEADAAIVALAGRAGVFSAGFDLKVLRAGGPNARTMLRAGFELAERMLSFPMPVVIACTGHAVAMGVFLVLSGDYRIGVTGRYKITANEVAIGLTFNGLPIDVNAEPVCASRSFPCTHAKPGAWGGLGLDVSVYANLVRVGRTSMTVHLEAWALRRRDATNTTTTALP